MRRSIGLLVVAATLSVAANAHAYNLFGGSSASTAQRTRLAEQAKHAAQLGKKTPDDFARRTKEQERRSFQAMAPKPSTQMPFRRTNRENPTFEARGALRPSVVTTHYSIYSRTGAKPSLLRAQILAVLNGNRMSRIDFTQARNQAKLPAGVMNSLRVSDEREERHADERSIFASLR